MGRRRASMSRAVPAVIAGCLFLACASVAAQETPGGVPRPPLRPGQAVYIVAVKTDGSPDIVSAERVRKAFERRAAFRPVQRLSETDFVFLVVTVYKVYLPSRSASAPVNLVSDLIDVLLDSRGVRSAGNGSGGDEVMTGATGFAVPVGVYPQDDGNRDALREAAYWQGQDSSAHSFSIPERHTGNVVKKFHEAVAGKKKGR
jgi:hypothetical protein